MMEFTLFEQFCSTLFNLFKGSLPEHSSESEVQIAWLWSTDPEDRFLDSLLMMLSGYH